MAELNGTAPADVRAAAKNLIVSALDESTVIAALPDEQVRLGLTLAGKPETTRVDLVTARELAVRGAVRTVVTGTTDQVGQTYHAAVRVLDADSDVVVASRRDIARGDDDLIPTLDRVVRALRMNLGERRAAIAANRRLEQAATPSFAAYQRYQRARELNYNNDNVGARAALKEALVLDPGFAAAWRALGPVYNNLGFQDSADAANDEALARPDRLTEDQRLQAEALRLAHTSGGDTRPRLAALERAYQRYPGPPVNLGASLHYVGRDSEAVVLYEAWARRAPFGLRPIERNNLTISLLAVGRIDDARRMAESLSGERRTWGRLAVAAWTAEWTAGDSLALSLLEQASSQPLRTFARVAQASAAAARGRLREALATLDALDSARICCRVQGIVLRVVSGSPVAPPQPSDAQGTRVVIVLQAAAAGDTATARAVVARFRRLPPDRHFQGDTLMTLAEAWVAALAGRPAEVIRLLRPLTGEGTPNESISPTQAVHWSLSAAYERQGQLDSAAAVLERLAAWQGLTGVLGNLRGLTHSFAHQRLVVLYARLGRLADARRHWRVFSATFTNPDPELVHLVDEARAALATAERRQ